MRTFRVLMLAALATGSLALMAPGASASAPASTASFCKAVAGISSDIGDDPSSGGNTATLASALRKAAKSAPSKVKGAVLTMADYFDAASGSSKTSPEKIAAFLRKSGAKYAKAVATFTSYYAKNCTGVS
jgi:hypothetical protein